MGIYTLLLVDYRLGGTDRTLTVYLDRKSIISNPLLDGRLQIYIGTKLNGIVKTVVDYGYFVELSVGLDALLHKSLLMDGISLNQSDLVSVEITDINYDKGRISLKLISC